MPALGRPSDKYRRERAARSGAEHAIQTRIAAHITDPVRKLRYLQAAAGDAAPAGVIERLRARTIAHRLRVASIALALALVLVPLVIAGVAFNAAPRAGAEPRRQVARVAALAPAPHTPQPQPEIVREPVTNLPAVAEPMTPAVRALTPTIIWLADRGRDWELYSNGLRIETRYAVSGEPRRFQIHDRTAGLQRPTYTHPIGILFHTSESDLWPLEPDYRSELRVSSARLLGYVRTNQSYNYVIDRFGRVYRVVDDETRANHAGHSVWARGDDVYLDLNAAFLGVAFESRWEGGHALPITTAQLNAGRNLTDYLRQRFAIAPELCVTHGLASVSAKQQLIGYHLDWARGFPFAAFGLPDLYREPTPAIALFGFGYDARFLQDVGEPWPGISAAEALLERDAAVRGISIYALRTERRARYREWTREIRGGSGTAGESATQPPADKRG